MFLRQNVEKTDNENGGIDGSFEKYNKTPNETKNERLRILDSNIQEEKVIEKPFSGKNTVVNQKQTVMIKNKLDQKRMIVLEKSK